MVLCAICVSFVCCVGHLSGSCVPCVICLSLYLCVSVFLRLEAPEGLFFVLEAVEEVSFVLCFAATHTGVGLRSGVWWLW